MRNVCLVALTFLLPAAAFAQQPSSGTAATSDQKAYVAVHLGGQAGSASLIDTFTFTEYDELATVTTDQDYGGGFLFNIEGGYKVMDRLFAGLAITRSSSDSNSRITAAIPHPEIFDAHRTATLDATDASHGETGFHFFASYLFAVRPNVDVRVFAGPSIIRASHDFVTAVAFEEGAPPFTSVTLTGATLASQTHTVGAFHFGAGGTYHVTERLGVDGFFRFARRTVDVDGAVNQAEMRVGGAQIGVGVRYGF